MTEDVRSVDAACRDGVWEILGADFEGMPVQFHHGNVEVVDLERPITAHVAPGFDPVDGEYVILRPAFPDRRLLKADVSIDHFDPDRKTYQGSWVHENLRFSVIVSARLLRNIPLAFVAQPGLLISLDLEPVAASHLEAVALCDGEWDRLLREERPLPIRLHARLTYPPYGYKTFLSDETPLVLSSNTVKALSPKLAALQPDQAITAWIRPRSEGGAEITRLHDDLLHTLARKSGEEYYAEVIKVTPENVTLAVWDPEYKNAIFVNGFRSLFREAGVFELSRPTGGLGRLPRDRLEAEIEAQEASLRDDSRTKIGLLKVTVAHNGSYLNLEEVLAPRGVIRPKAGEERFGVSACSDGTIEPTGAVLFEVCDPSVGTFEVALTPKTYLARAKDQTVASVIAPILSRSNKLRANLNLVAYAAKKGGRCRWSVKMVNWIKSE